MDEAYVLSFLPEAAQATGPLSCGQNENVVDNGLNGWSCQMLWQIHHAAYAEVTALPYFHTLYWSLSSRSFFCIPQNDDPHPLFHGLYITSKHDLCQEYMGKYAVIPPLRRNFPGDVSALDVIERLLSDADIPLELEDSITFSLLRLYHCPLLTLGWFSSTLDVNGTLTLLYYASYLTMTVRCFHVMTIFRSDLHQAHWPI